MKRLIVLGALLAMALLVAAPAVMAQTITQSNTGDVISQNVAEQEAAQYQYAPGGDAEAFVDESEVDEENETLNVTIRRDNGLFNNHDDGYAYYDDNLVVIDEGDDEFDIEVDQEGGDGGEQHLTQEQDQTATATGATFSAVQ